MRSLNSCLPDMRSQILLQSAALLLVAVTTQSSKTGTKIQDLQENGKLDLVKETTLGLLGNADLSASEVPAKTVCSITLNGSDSATQHLFDSHRNRMKERSGRENCDLDFRVAVTDNEEAAVIDANVVKNGNERGRKGLIVLKPVSGNRLETSIAACLAKRWAAELGRDGLRLSGGEDRCLLDWIVSRERQALVPYSFGAKAKKANLHLMTYGRGFLATTDGTPPLYSTLRVAVFKGR